MRLRDRLNRKSSVHQPNADDASARSGRSNKSATSFRSIRSRGSARSRRSGGGKSVGGSRKGGGRNNKGNKYGALPFDEEGYCHAHPGVKLAKKKTLGIGWKVLHDICPDCAHDASSQAGSKSSRIIGGGDDDNDSDDDASSYKSGKSSGSRKKRIRVKGMKYRDDESGKDGRYSGYVDEDHSPHGEGKMKYKDGSVFVGVWSEGSQVHGKTTKGSKNKNKKNAPNNSSNTKSSDRSKKSGSKQEVRKMKWMDYYGDPGEYTGEVDPSQKLPNGNGSMKYNHGLIQEGLWAKGQFVEGSDNLAKDNGGGEVGKKYKSKSSSGGRSGGNGGRKTRSSGSSKRLEP